MDKQIKTKSFWASLMDSLSSPKMKDALMAFLKKGAIRMALKRFALIGGIKGWLISFVIEELIEEVDEHLVTPVFAKIGFYADSLEGKKIYRKVHNAQDIDDWHDSIADV